MFSIIRQIVLKCQHKYRNYPGSVGRILPVNIITSGLLLFYFIFTNRFLHLLLQIVFVLIAAHVSQLDDDFGVCCIEEKDRCRLDTVPFFVLWSFIENQLSV